MLLKLQNIGKIYNSNDILTIGIRGVNLEFDYNEFVCVEGESGSGKSTLLNVIGANDSYEEGELYINGFETSHYSESEWEKYREKNIATVFQDFNIIENLTVLENVELALLRIDDKKERRRIATELIEKVGLTKQTKQRGSKLSGGEKQTVEITDNRFTVANVGEYHLVYKASSPSYKTSLGNDAYTEYDVKIISSVGGSTLAKFTDGKGVLPEGTAIMASRMEKGSSIYRTAADKMKTIADNFEVFGVSFVSGDGNSVSLSENIELYLQANTTYDRTKIVVYYMDDSGNLTKLNASGYGRYVKVDTDKTGTFIVCIPGVAFVMPMWGYAVICCVCGAIVLASAITIPIVVVKHKRKKNEANKLAQPEQ